ncbi:MerR family transcriptional regulator, partial [Clostridioides difficile]|uniref:MerR family transcriptional regulator n=2 Tax=Bacteria TaxID=2 RepID=UPI001054B3B7
MRNDLYYSSKDVAKRLSIEPVTVRKYSQMLEEQGYSFKKDEKNWRQYSEDDVHFLEYICHLKEMGKSLDESIQHVAS